MMYHAIASKLDEDGRLKLDAILGDPDAVAEVARDRVASVAGAGFEVG
jgi:hypothetical protein